MREDVPAHGGGGPGRARCARAQGRPLHPLHRAPDPIQDARPGSLVATYVPDGDGNLSVARLTWGFPLDDRPNAVFNTRIEPALEQLRCGRRGMWAKAIARGLCLVSARAFYESSDTERAISERAGSPVRRQYLFRLAGARAFLLAAIQRDGRFSIVSTTPNASVAPIHGRIPLVLCPGESSAWLGNGFASLADRSHIQLVCNEINSQ